MGAIIFSIIYAAVAAKPPSGAVKFVIIDPDDGVVGTPSTITVEAQKSNNQVDGAYQEDVELVAGGSATGDGRVYVTNGIGTIDISDTVAETVDLSLLDTYGTGLDVSSVQTLTFVVTAPAAWNLTNFWFRDDDGTEISATGYGTAETAKNESAGPVLPGAIRVRAAIRASSSDGIVSPQLEFKEGNSCDGNGWTAVSGIKENFTLQPSENFTDGDPTTQQISSGQFIAGQILESTNPAVSLAVPKNKSTEYEWSLVVADEVPDLATFAFRVTNGGAAFDTYQRCPVLTIRGRGGGAQKERVLRVSGKAYPGAKVELVERGAEKGELVRQETTVPENGDFEITNRWINSDSYAYSLLVKDKDGRKTQTKVYNADFLANTTVIIENIFFPPTVDLKRAVVTKGDVLKVVGFASANNKVKLELDDGTTHETKADGNGNYQMLVNTAALDYGRHNIRGRQSDPNAGKESDWSLTKGFLVSRSTVPRADFSGDGKIDVKDWSIFLASWKDKSMVLDLDDNNKVDISDLSIFLRGFRKI